LITNIKQEEDHVEGTLLLIRELFESVREKIELDCLESAIITLENTLDNEKYSEESVPLIEWHWMKARLTQLFITWNQIHRKQSTIT